MRTTAALLLLTLAACGKLTTLTVTETATTSVAGATLVEQLAGGLPFSGFTNMDLSQNETLKNQGVKKNQIDSCKLTAVTLSITSPANETLDFLTSLSFSAATSGSPTVTVASGSSFNAASASLTVPDVELKPYVTADSMNITTSANAHSPAQDTNVLATLTFAVQVDLAGVITGR